MKNLILDLAVGIVAVLATALVIGLILGVVWLAVATKWGMVLLLLFGLWALGSDIRRYWYW